MPDKYFIDTNIWLYAFMEENGSKKEAAISVISKMNVVLSTQVLNEACINLIKKADYKEEDISKFVENLYNSYNIVIIDKKVITKSSEIRKKYMISYWDSLVVASALESGCNIFYSEDLKNGQLIEEKLKIINPFL